MSGCHQHLALVFLPRRSAGDTSHGMVRFGHSLQSTKWIHPQPCLTACQEHRTGLGAHLNPPSSRVTFIQAAEGLVQVCLDYLPEQRFPGQPAGLQLPLWNCFLWSEIPLLAAFPCHHHLPCVPIPAWAVTGGPGWTKLSTSSSIHMLPISMALHTSHHPVCISQFSSRDTLGDSTKGLAKGKANKIHFSQPQAQSLHLRRPQQQLGTVCLWQIHADFPNHHPSHVSITWSPQGFAP